MTNIDLNQQVEIEFWRNAEGESPESNSLQNIINKLIDANTLVDCFEKYRDELSQDGRILELGGIRREYDIAQEGKLGVNEGRAIHGRDHRDFDIKMIK